MLDLIAYFNKLFGYTGWQDTPAVADPAPVVSTMPPNTDYAALYALATITPAKHAATVAQVKTLLSNQARYEAVSVVCGAPWVWIAAIHWMEASGSFRCHLHNGDPLTARTVHVPAGRPATGKAPFSWEASAMDAMAYEGIVRTLSWDLASALKRAEAYNGMGYSRRGLRTPYLWSATNVCSPGKYVADGEFDETAVSDEIGVAAMFKAIEATGIKLF